MKKGGKIQDATFLNSFQLIVAFCDVFRGYSNATHTSHFHSLIFVLKLFRDVAVLYFSGKFHCFHGLVQREHASEDKE